MWLFVRIQPQWPLTGFSTSPHMRGFLEYSFHATFSCLWVCFNYTPLYLQCVCGDNIYVLITFTFFFFKVGTATLCGDLKAFLSNQNLPKGKNVPLLPHYRSDDFTQIYLKCDPELHLRLRVASVQQACCLYRLPCCCFILHWEIIRIGGQISWNAFTLFKNLFLLYQILFRIV